MFVFCSGLILFGVTLRVWFWSLSSRTTRLIPLLHHCLDDLLPALFQIVNDSLLSGSFPSVFKHALLSLFSESLFLTTATLRAIVQSCPWVFIPVQSHWGNSSVAVLRLLEFPSLPFPVCLLSMSQHRDSSTQNDYGHSACSGWWWCVCLNHSRSVLCFRYIDHHIFFHRLQSLSGISGTVLSWFTSYLTDSYCDCQWPELKICFCLVSHRDQFLALSSSFSTLDRYALWMKLILPTASRLLMTQTLQSCLLIRYSPLSWPYTHTSLTWRPGWRKTNWNWMTTTQRLSSWSQTDAQSASLRVGTADIPFMACVHNLGIMISDNKHISTVCHSVKVKIRRICSIRQYLMVKVARTVCAFILSKLNCCNSHISSVLSDCPLYLLSKLQ